MRLVAEWDNPAAGDVEQLEKVVECCGAADSPILESGSGITTLVLAVHGPQPVWTLEQDERWFWRIRWSGGGGARPSASRPLHRVRPSAPTTVVV